MLANANCLSRRANYARTTRSACVRHQLQLITPAGRSAPAKIFKGVRQRG